MLFEWIVDYESILNHILFPISGSNVSEVCSKRLYLSSSLSLPSNIVIGIGLDQRFLHKFPYWQSPIQFHREEVYGGSNGLLASREAMSFFATLETPLLGKSKLSHKRWRIIIIFKHNYWISANGRCEQMVTNDHLHHFELNITYLMDTFYNNIIIGPKFYSLHFEIKYG